MCGIVGIANVSSDGPVDTVILQRMSDALSHRGPDEGGVHVDPGVALGIRRLSVVDIRSGQQPLHNEDRSVWAVVNGEIYNHAQLRKELEADGHAFRTRTDVETIVHLYEKYGDGCVRHLNGMFAFALWDTKRRRLLLGRDRVGEKPLYYSLREGTLRFGSEIKCLLVDPGQTRQLDPISARDFFTYLYVPGARTIFDGIQKLMPGHILTLEHGRCTVRRYWELTPRDPSPTREDEDVVDGFLEHFRRSVRMRLSSEVPIGAFLSGGIDSSAVVAVMAEQTSRPVQTFTIACEGADGLHDERSHALRVAEYFSTEHHEFVVRPNMVEIMPRIVRAFDEPFADSSAIPNWCLAQVTRQHVTVALSGIGGDEIAGGYNRYVGVLASEQYVRLPRLVREQIISRIVSALPDLDAWSLAINRARRFVSSAASGPVQRYEHYVSTFDSHESDRLFLPAVRAGWLRGGGEAPLAAALERWPAADLLTRLTFADLATYVPDDLLALGDRTSMAHSLEVRAPFLDHELLEYIATVPSDLKIRGWTKKYLFRRAFKALLPRETLSRRKMGFSVPLGAWLRGSLRSFLLDWLSCDRIRRIGLFDDAFVTRLLSEHFDRRHNHENKLWALLVFAMWHHEYLESPDGGSRCSRSMEACWGAH
jgi:asparagine synthase (glutamine-hydrolysing)